MSASLEELVRCLLRDEPAPEGRGGAAPWRAVATPFGVVVPPAWARGRAGAFDHLQLEVVARAPEGAEVALGLRFRHALELGNATIERHVALLPRSLAQLAEEELVRELTLAGGQGRSPEGRVRLRARRLDAEHARLQVRLENTTSLPAEPSEALDAAAVLRRSFLACHVLLELSRGRFLSPLDTACAGVEPLLDCTSVNVWPVLASPDDDVLLGAPIMLPDHPAVAPQGLAALFHAPGQDLALRDLAPSDVDPQGDDAPFGAAWGRRP